MMFDQHQVVFSDGLASESFFPGPFAMSTLDTDARLEVLTLFPELATRYGASARIVLRAFEAELLV